MANLNRRWRRWMATGCLHSVYACREYQRNVRAFKKDFRPDRHIELGDVLDTACLRGGARGTKDETEPLEPDVRAALNWIREMEPSDWMLGNHDTRVVELIDHPSAIVAELSRRLWADMQAAAGSVKCKIHHYDIETGWLTLGNTDFGHGFMYNVNAVRDHVEMRRGNNVVMAHVHKPEFVPGRVIGAPWGICVGLGADPRKMKYARRRRQTLAWGHGLAYGYFCDNDSTGNVLSWRCAHGEKEDPRWIIS
ncbi:MAG: hypothetical protein ABFD89_13215 [Bryobacteraceae bacterium]